ncbi:5-(carboxyamino)imidazole ribonucleotide synthase [Paracoccus shanxieyensis]|uniref:N5-carboxyaminoimidazole ribonucleotide synthase n=1 Tax=Paracoccus shanxieyensis TaxID=2675752 RepID=A0A6L6IXR2_9RHOB|nr:5-(carboxyamino)imidazole ribonucleotide synthase [Paracoccus shanxieyensis]MTH64391.1 5-(carboxyamino)imidazole ribonucleotide synthase [Paracoccus shanxieyensis]MTH87616.1 5-(carboxyamino)imidazole ribonucleotide synthase [Paracoccus shanxieyensis]
MTELHPGATIGILGGGQLGRMLSVAASRLGYRTHVYEPGAAPAGDVAHAVTTAPYEDQAALRAFAEAVDVITYEFENVPTAALDLLESIRPIRPNRRTLAVSQDRLTEKNFLTEIGLRCAPYRNVETQADLPQALADLGTPAILKTRRMGYDGKGQIRFNDAQGGDWTGAPSVLEGFVDFSAEVSVIVARGADGQVAAFDPGLNVHRDGILRTTTVPCGLSQALLTDAVLIAAKIVNALDYVGVMGVELFVTPGGLIVNEIAPRVHNSGHWTQAGCAVDQFEQHIRAVAGLPLGDGQRYADVEMQNLIGDDIDRVPQLLTQPRTQVHLYGKGAARPGRKMGHVNRVL